MHEPENGSACYPFSDLALARRLERAEGRGCASFVDTRAALFPQSGVAWIEVAGAFVVFDGPASPVTQTFGLGLSQEKVTAAHLDAIEGFYRERGSPIFHEVSPMADMGLIFLLNERGYEPFEFTNVLVRPLSREMLTEPPPASGVRVRRTTDDDADVWAKTAARGWSDSTEFAAVIEEFARLNTKRPDTATFLAELDGEPIATGALCLNDGVGLLAGASTVPERRRHGAQLALLEARLRFAAEQGCDLAMMGALPGTSSQRNAERQGFRIVYTRIKWRRRGPPGLPPPAAASAT